MTIGRKSVCGASRWPGGAAAALLAVLVGGCASGPSGGIADPLEPLNRAVFRFNEVADGLVIEPAAELYGLVVPEAGRTSLRNFLDNAGSPVVFVNDLLQLERERAGVTLARFMINTFFGGLGLFDAARHFGHVRHEEDFGQTLAVWGVGDGAYLVLPILGPSSLRDATGSAVDGFLLDPAVYIAPSDARLAARVADGVDTRYRLDPVIEDLRANAMDRYATVRTVYQQRRQAAIANGRATAADPDYEAIFQDPEAEDGTSN
ncbi:MlaA family lipoprotein [Marinimicrococcus flavescens]|uniref:VacJ family lipoprotein n=1 Tax=Marinimicrococcus flavescens TaxID=3031815 RepID=A0AAP3XST0_9PROT|nr:VacJ family lipoprotein [Marinimicrococcus flavescens]